MSISKKSFVSILIFLLSYSDSLLSQQATLDNTSWQLVAIYGFNNSEFIPKNPENYLLRFRLDNRLQIEADCNQAGATWTQEGDSLTLTEIVTTRKLCVHPSLFNLYIMNLERTDSYELKNGQLIIRTNNGVDWMAFQAYTFTPSF